MNQTKENTIWINYLRSFITVLVVLHHSMLSYTTFAHFNKEIYINSTHVVVDSHRWKGLDVLVNFNDIYFMSLMFLIAGLFLIQSIERKGRETFLLDRFKRLFLPFILLGTFFMLIAYIPGYYLSQGSFILIEYIRDYFTTQRWPVGPPWFIWVLFLFNFLFVLSYPTWLSFYKRCGIKLQNWQHQPFKILLGFIFFTALLYIPMTAELTTDSWVGIGPFDMQSNRFFLYLGYFFIGVVLGGIDFNRNVLSSKSKIVRLWKFWCLLAILVFVGLTIMPDYLLALIEQGKMSETMGYAIYYVVYTISCSLTTLAMLTSFKAGLKEESKWWNSFSDHAYMIYLCHFIFVVWIQFFLLEIEVHASVKALLTFSLTLILSWLLSLLLRRIKILGKYV